MMHELFKIYVDILDGILRFVLGNVGLPVRSYALIELQKRFTLYTVT